MERFVYVELQGGAKNYFRPSAVTKFTLGSSGTLSVHFTDGLPWTYEGDDAQNVYTLLKTLLFDEPNP